MAMPEFMVMITANEAADARLAPPVIKGIVEGHSAYERSLRAASAFLDGERFRPSSEGRRVSATEVEHGPFGETALVAYYLITADDLDAAVVLAQGCPMSPGTTVDVRPVMKGKLQPGKANQQGRIFAFAVLGNAANEQAWIDAMDRIDASTRDSIQVERSLGGVRLHAPGRGRTVTPTAVFDGPFLESKEVIGGLFFMRWSTIEEAVEWARTTEFVRHGSVEIRELWRS
jgi:hypothetical protein